MHERFKKKVTLERVHECRLGSSRTNLIVLGVLIKVLNSRIYPLYSVFRPPAYQEYLDLFTRMFDKHQLYNTTGKVLEIGIP
jgi:hypothetical protein